jgi:cyclopropane fatty-acyl-phospholipid synthase-like methyltransferase
MTLEAHAFEILEKAGIERGKTVLDFGCGSGTYTIPAYSPSVRCFSFLLFFTGGG